MRISFLFLLSTIILFIGGCSLYAPVYIGEKYTPTTTVEMFYSVNDIKRPYHVIGHMDAPTSRTASGQARTKKSVIDKAKKIGADAVVFSQLDRQVNEKTPDDFSLKVEVVKYD